MGVPIESSATIVLLFAVELNLCLIERSLVESLELFLLTPC